MGLTKENMLEIQARNDEELLRNPQVDFTGHKNLATQTGAKSVAAMIEDFRRAGQAIMVARADQVVPEMPGLPAYPDPIEVKLLQQEVDAELLIARKNLIENQNEQVKAFRAKAEKNERELERIQKAAKAVETTTEPPEE